MRLLQVFLKILGALTLFYFGIGSSLFRNLDRSRCCFSEGARRARADHGVWPHAVDLVRHNLE